MRVAPDILYLIGIFQPIGLVGISTMLKNYFGNDMPSYLIEPCISNLFTKEHVRINEENSNLYSLSNTGNQYVYNDLLDKHKLGKKFSRIRTLVINSNLRKRGKLDLGTQRNKFLAV